MKYQIKGTNKIIDTSRIEMKENKVWCKEGAHFTEEKFAQAEMNKDGLLSFTCTLHLKIEIEESLAHIMANKNEMKADEWVKRAEAGEIMRIM